MAISNFLPAPISTVSNFHCLALFICHLFADGSFRTVHILYHPNAFDHNILMQIDSICFDPIQFYFTNIIQSFQTPHQESDSIDDILQIIFFNPENMASEIEQFGGDNFALYRIFVFSSIEIITALDQNLLFKTEKRIFDTRTLILHYNESNASVFIENSFSEQSIETVNSRQEPIFILNHEINLENVNLFDRTFGAYEQMESIDIYRINHYVSLLKLQPSLYLHDIFESYCHLHLNRSFIITIWIHKRNSLLPRIYHRTVIDNEQREYYKEESLDFKFIEDVTQ